MPADRADDCVAALRQAGYPEATALGRIHADSGAEAPIDVVPAGGAPQRRGAELAPGPVGS